MKKLVALCKEKGHKNYYSRFCGRYWAFLPTLTTYLEGGGVKTALCFIADFALFEGQKWPKIHNFENFQKLM